MKRVLLSGLIGAALLVPGVGEATVVNWTNTGLLTFPPQVDAVNFYNTGAWDIQTTLPFQTANTLNFYNNGRMFGGVGFQFDTDSTLTGQRRMANSFSNGPLGLVQALDTLGGFGSGFCIPAAISPSYLLISATNITGGGRRPSSMIVGANGSLELKGKNVNLSRSGLQVLPVWQSAIGSVNIESTNFIPDVAIFDQYWAQASYDVNYPINTASIWQFGFFAVSQPGLPQANPPPQLVLFGPAADSYVNNLGTLRVGITNFTGSPTNVLTIRESFVDVVTNMTKGAAFVGANLPAQIGFTRGGNNALGSYDTISVLLSTQVPNAVSGRPEAAFLRVVDTLAAFTNRGIATNLIGCEDIQGRPANYLVDRLQGVGGPGNHGYPENNFFIASGARLTSTNVASDAVTNVLLTAGDYAAYGAFVDNVVLRPPAVPGATVTNLPGRVRITADNLDLSETRIRGEGEIVIKTANLISSSNAVIDCENLSFDLASTNGNLRIQSLAPDTVARLKGNIYAWSSFWSNTAFVVVTNNYEFTTNVIDGTNIVATVLVTNPTGTTNGQTMTVAGLGVRTWRDNVTNPAVQISTASTIAQAGVNLYDQVSSFPFPGLGVFPVAGGIALQTGPNGNIDVVLSPGWGTVTYATNESFTNIVATAVGITNSVEIGMHVLILDATELSSTTPVTVHELVTRSPNVVVDDNLSIGQLLSFDAQRLTLNGDITLPPSSKSTNWNNTIAPNVRYFTNAGTLFVWNEAHFGDDLPTPYSAFVNTNTGTIDTWSLVVKSDYLENSGTLLSVDSMILQTINGKLENGSSFSGANTDFQAGTLKFNNYSLRADGTLNLDVASALFDAGAASANLFRVRFGFNLLVKPSTGDLLGTTFQSEAPDFSYPEHTWAGQDRGATAAGYSNNVAIGQLVLGPVGLGPFFTFSGTSTANGLYTDVLDLTSLGANYTNDLQIDPNLTIYYAAAKLGVTPPASNGAPQLPEEYLNGQFGGRLLWVPEYAGPNSSTDVVINGKTVKVNRALRNSQIIDSDGDGIPNYFDDAPFDTLVLTGAMVGNNPPTPRAFAITWQALPNIAYQVEFTTDAKLINWQPLTGYTNHGPAKITATVWDTNATPSAVRRFYRISYRP